MSTPTPINKLKAAMQGMAGTAEAAPAMVQPAGDPAPLRKTPINPSRQGKRVVSAYINASAAKQLRVLAADNETSSQGLLEEALNDLFRKYNRSAIA